MGQKIYLTELELQNIIEDATLEVLNENQQNELLGTALALGALAGGASYIGKKRQQGYKPWKNAYRWAKSKINGTEYEPQIKQPSNISDVKEFQINALKGGKYRNGDNIIVGKWGPSEQNIWNQSQKQTDNNGEEVKF